jgi:hypothetical protein
MPVRAEHDGERHRLHRVQPGGVGEERQKLAGQQGRSLGPPLLADGDVARGRTPEQLECLLGGLDVLGVRDPVARVPVSMELRAGEVGGVDQQVVVGQKLLLVQTGQRLDRDTFLVECRQGRAVAGAWTEQHPDLTTTSSGRDELPEQLRRSGRLAMRPPGDPQPDPPGSRAHQAAELVLQGPRAIGGAGVILATHPQRMTGDDALVRGRTRQSCLRRPAGRGGRRPAGRRGRGGSRPAPARPPARRGPPAGPGGGRG